MILPEILVEHFNLTESKKVGEKLRIRDKLPIVGVLELGYAKRTNKTTW